MRARTGNPCSRAILACSSSCLCMALASHPTSTAPHQLWAVGFPNIFPLDKNIQDTHIAAVVIHLKAAARQPREQPWTDIPASLKREPVALRDTISLAWPLAIDCFHQQQFQIIGRPQILRDA